ncbi:hypothetical protein [Streptomyces sp. NPDC051214]|uniref:hypothetical protein n=1 Tax=Streptomyces sp. NPDC051214 TaxID=3155282 RepID=UPI00341978F2
MRPRTASVEAAAPPPERVARDRHWSADLRDTIFCAGVLLALLIVLDAARGELTLPRTALWCALAVLLFAVLLPPKVSAGQGWLASRGLLRTKRVRTDRLISVRWIDGVSQRLVLRDLYGTRVEIDPTVLTANPDLWALLEHGAHISCQTGLMTCGATALRQLSRRVDSETAHLLFKISGMR